MGTSTCSWGVLTILAFENIPFKLDPTTSHNPYYLTQILFTELLLLCYALLIAAIRAFRKRAAIFIVLSLILMLNFVERAFLLGGYQGASYPGTFFPETPGISFLESKMQKYERMVSIGRSFVPSFPMYYSINTLVAHAFADPAFKGNLELISPGIYATNTTQPIFDPSSIDLASPLLDVYRVRYVVLSPSANPIGWVSLANQTEYNRSYDLRTLKSFGQTMTSSRNGYMNTLEIVIHTPRNEPIPVNVKILSNNTLLADFYGQAVAKDNGRYSIDLPSLQVKEGQQLAFEIAPVRESIPQDSYLYSVNFDIYGGGTIILNGKQSAKQGDLAFALLEYNATVANKYKLVHTGDLTIYENTTLGEGIPVITKLIYANQTSCASTLGQIDPSHEAVVEDKSVSITGGAAATQVGPAQVAGGIPASTARISEYEATSVVIDADVPQTSMIVLSDTYFPGWHATVDGKETAIYRVNCDMRGIIVAAGNHVIKMQYDPSSFKIGLAISLIILAALGILYLVIAKRTSIPH